MTGNLPHPYVQATDAAHWIALATAAGMDPMAVIQADGKAGLHITPPTDPDAPRPVAPGTAGPSVADVIAELVAPVARPDVDALRSLLLDMLTPDRSTTLVSSVQHVLPLADRLAAILAPHLTAAEKVEVSQRMAAFQDIARRGAEC